MKTEPNDSAFHSVVDYEQLSRSAQVQGLTKREYFAAMAVRGLATTSREIGLFGKSTNRGGVLHADTIASLAVEIADSLITALNKPTGEKQTA